MSAKDQAIFVRVPKHLSDRLEEQSNRLQSSKSVIIRMALIKFLEEQEKDAPTKS